MMEKKIAYISEFIEALTEEIKEQKSSRIALKNGKQIDSPSSNDFWYQFYTERSLPVDVPCKLTIQNESFNAIIVNVKDNIIILSLDRKLPDSLEHAELENGAKYLLKRLKENIQENIDIPTIGKRMLPFDNAIYRFKQIYSYDANNLDSENTTHQNEAILSALTNDITYIWGPPGTGKTTVIGHIINGLLQQERSALIVSYTNTAVDNAIDRADKIYYETHHNNDDISYPILRIGNHVKLLSERVLLYSRIQNKTKDFISEKNFLMKERYKRSNQLQKLNSILNNVYEKEKWLSENKLNEIGAHFSKLSDFQQRFINRFPEIEEQLILLKNEKNNHPEYNDYHILKDRFQETNDTFNTICNQISDIEMQIQEINLSINIAQNEIKKHDEYDITQQFLLKYQSSEFYRVKLDELNEDISQYDCQIKSITSIIERAEAIQSEYLDKDFLSKLFSKKQYQKAINDIFNYDNLLAQKNALISEAQKQKELYEQIYKVVQSAESKLGTIKTLKSREDSELELSQSQQKQTDLNAHLSTLKKKKHVQHEECIKNESRLNHAKEWFDYINDQEKCIRKIEIECVIHCLMFKLKKKEIIEGLKEEQRKCAKFYSCDIKRIRSSYEEFIYLREKIKKGLSKTNFSVLKNQQTQICQKLLNINTKLETIKQEIKSLETKIFLSAKIIGTSLVNACVNTDLPKKEFDTIILDEASTASMPALWCASYLAKKNIIIVGDFLQLSPIVNSKSEIAQKWLGNDVFYHSGLLYYIKDKNMRPKNFIMLDDQFRMESDIADIANIYYNEYGGLHSNDTARIPERNRFYTWYSGNQKDSHVHLIDTSSLHAFCNERLNLINAIIIVKYAFKLLENKLNADDSSNTTPAQDASILVIAPYKNQILKIQELIEQEYKNRGYKNNLNYIQAGTVYSMQGSEADIVIFDLVLDDPCKNAMLFTTCNEHDRNMFNVAVTRAKFQLFIFGNLLYCYDIVKDKNNALSEFLRNLLIEKQITRTDAKLLFSDADFIYQTSNANNETPYQALMMCNEQSFYEQFLNDIRSFQETMIIYSPYIAVHRLSDLLPVFADAINSGKKISVYTKNINDREENEKMNYKIFEDKLKNIGVQVYYQKNMHQKIIFIDDKIHWIGSLNVLSCTGKTREIMTRIADKEITQKIKSEISKTKN